MAFDAGSIEANLTLDRNPFNEGLRRAQRDAREFEKKRWRATVGLDVDSKQAERALREFERRSGGRIRIGVDVDGRGVERQLDDIVRNTGATAARSGNQMARLLLNPLVLQFGLLPGIAGAAAAGSAVALGAIAVGFAGIAAVAQKDNPKIKAAYKNLWEDIRNDTQRMTAPLVPYLQGVAGQIQRGFDVIKPNLQAVFAVAGPGIQDLVDDLLGLAKNAMPGVTFATLNSKQAMEGFGNLLRSTGSGISGFFVEIATRQREVGDGATYMGQVIEKTLTVLGTLLGQFSGGFAEIGPQFVATFNQLLDVITQVTGGGLTGFSTAMNVLLPVITGVLHVIEPIAAGLGTMGGSLLGVIAGWKLLTGTLGLAAKAFSLLSPAAMIARMGPMTAALNSAAVGFGNLAMRATMSGEAGNKAEAGFRKVSAAVTRTASALPILGAAIIAGQAAIEHYFPSAEELAEKIALGGKAAEDAKKKMSDYADNTTVGGALLKTFGTSMDEVNKKFYEQYNAMSPLQRAQTDLTIAQNNLTLAQNRYGEQSPQASAAAGVLAAATDKVAAAQKKAEDATKSHTDRIIEQTNLLLGEVGARLQYQQSLLTLEQSQKSLTEAVKQHGASSLEARNADVAYQQNLVSVVEAVGRRATAEAEAKGITDTAAYATSAMNAEILRLAGIAGENAPPALRQLVSGLDDSALAALGAKRDVDSAGNAVIRLPDGKVLKFPNDAPQARLQVEDLKAAIDRVPKNPTVNWHLNYIRTVTGQGPPAVPPGTGGLPLGDTGQRADGGWIRGPGGPRDDNLLFWLSNKEFVVNAREAAWAGPLLEYINSGRARAEGFQTGYRRADGGWANGIDHGTISQEHWDSLLAAGWRGNPNDGREALYPPATQGRGAIDRENKPENYRPTQNAFTEVNRWMGRATPLSLTPSVAFQAPPRPTGAVEGDPSLFGSQNQWNGQTMRQLGMIFEDVFSRALAQLDGAKFQVDGQGFAKLIRNEVRLYKQT